MVKLLLHSLDKMPYTNTMQNLVTEKEHKTSLMILLQPNGTNMPVSFIFLPSAKSSSKMLACQIVQN